MGLPHLRRAGGPDAGDRLGAAGGADVGCGRPHGRRRCRPGPPRLVALSAVLSRFPVADRWHPAQPALPQPVQPVLRDVRPVPSGSGRLPGAAEPGARPGGAARRGAHPAGDAADPGAAHSRRRPGADDPAQRPVAGRTGAQCPRRTSERERADGGRAAGPGDPPARRDPVDVAGAGRAHRLGGGGAVGRSAGTRRHGDTGTRRHGDTGTINRRRFAPPRLPISVSPISSPSRSSVWR